MFCLKSYKITNNKTFIQKEKMQIFVWLGAFILLGASMKNCYKSNCFAVLFFLYKFQESICIYILFYIQNPFLQFKYAIMPLRGHCHDFS